MSTPVKPHPAFMREYFTSAPMAKNFEGIIKDIESRWNDRHFDFLGAINHVATHGAHLVPGAEHASTDEVHSIISQYVVSSFFNRNNGAIIESNPALNAMMANTDCDDIPIRMIRPAFPLSYYHFQQPLKVIDGVYVFWREHDIDPEDAEDMAFYNANIDDPYDGSRKLFQMHLYLASSKPEDYGLGHEIRFTFQEKSDVKLLPLLKRIMNESDMQAEMLDDSEANYIVGSVAMLIKTMLYMNCKDARAIKQNELTEFRGRLEGLGAKKLAKLEGKERLKYDRIIIGPEMEHVHTASATSSGSKSMHWRRGHFRNQPYGPGRAERQLTWIQPMLINHTPDEAPAPSKTYKIR